MGSALPALAIAVCIVEHEGRFALIKFKRNYLAGLWGLPGGKLDNHEHLSEGAVREIREELGVESEFERTLATIDEIAIDQAGKPTRFILFVCRVNPIGKVSTEPRDLPEGVIQWFSRDQIKSMKDEMVPSDYRIFSELADATEHALYKSKQEFRDEKLALSYFERVD